MPPDPLRAFVNRNYAKQTDARRAAIEARLRKRGFRPPDARPAAQPAQPTGPGDPPQPNAAQRNLLPPTFIGYGDVGRYRRPPRVNPEQFDIQRNEAGTYFTRPRTEMTGLDPQAVADIRGFDQQAGAQEGRIVAAYNDLASQSERDNAARAQALAEIGQLAGAGFNGADRTAATLAGSSQALTSTQSALQRAASAFNPTLARDRGQTVRSEFLGQYRGQRAERIGGYREMQSEAQAAAAETAQAAAEARAKLAADLRGQSLSYLGQLAGTQGQLAAAGLQSQTSLATNAQDNQTSLATNAQDNATSVATTQLRTQAQVNAALVRARASASGKDPVTGLTPSQIATQRRNRAQDTRAARGAYRDRRADAIEDVRKAFQGKLVQAKNPDGKPKFNADGTPVYDQIPGSAVQPMQMWSDLLDRGIKPVDAYNLIERYAPDGATIPGPDDLFEVLSRKMPKIRARRRVIALTGQDPVALDAPYSP